MGIDTSDLRGRVAAVPGVDALLPALEGLPPVYLVGGAVRDLLLGGRSVDLDLVVDGDARAVARELADRLDGEVRQHERFGTAAVRTAEMSFDLATARTESYRTPGALPDVERASLAEDLGRRDFAINAMAIALTGDDLGHLYDPHGGLHDLEQGVVRVLHEMSFLDDPTRLLRAVRYEVRLAFAMDEKTERLAVEAIDGGALATVSGARIRDELIDLLAEHESPSGVERMHALRIDTGLYEDLDPDPELVASAALGAVTIGADRALAALAALCLPRAHGATAIRSIALAPAGVKSWVESLALPAPERDSVLRAVAKAPKLALDLQERRQLPSDLRRLLAGAPPEELALALALGAPAEPVLRWVTELSRVRLEITGDDLLAAGVPEGPALGRALDQTLDRKLDGLVDGRDDELRTALELAAA
jgi:tRNA nucleotidyltransferase (CCA-adding enzyme)